ncbi:MAG: nuclear transport factor 2 family protein [Stenotrophobium sp.]
MNQQATLITGFYEGLQRLNAAAMTACYHPEVVFTDAVFQGLKGARACAMWRMLCERGKDLRVEFRDVQADALHGRAHWEAWYTFSGSGRPVHNIIEARFEFRDGLIWQHRDDFDLHHWAGQALGLTGKLLGGTGLLQNKIRANAAKALDAYIAGNRKN